MQLIKPYARMVSPLDGYEDDAGYVTHDKRFTLADGVAMMRRIEHAARISHRSEDAVTFDSYYRILRSVVLQHGDFSVIEHEKVTVEVEVDRGIQTEIVRHRLFSYTFESTRFVNYAKKIFARFVRPILSTVTAKASNGEPVELSAQQEWDHAINTADRAYHRLLDKGVAPQIARSVFPLALASKGRMTGNLRSWRHFFIMRTTKEAHPQMKEISIPLLQEFQRTIPFLFDDIVPERRQAESMTLLR